MDSHNKRVRIRSAIEWCVLLIACGLSWLVLIRSLQAMLLHRNEVPMGEFWSTLTISVVASIISSVLTAVITYRFYLRNLIEKTFGDRFEKRADLMQSDLKPSNQILHEEHGRLSAEIRDEVRTSASATQKSVEAVAATVAYLQNEQLEEKGRREQMLFQQLDAQRVADVISAQNVLISNLREEVGRLTEENRELRSQTQAQYNWQQDAPDDDAPEP